MAKIIDSPRRIITSLTRHPMRFLQPIIAFGVLVLVVGFSLVSYRLGVKLILVLAAVPIALGGFLIVLKYPILILVGSLLGGIFIPFSGPSGINVTALGMLLMIGVWIFKMVTEERRIILPPS